MNTNTLPYLFGIFILVWIGSLNPLLDGKFWNPSLAGSRLPTHEEWALGVTLGVLSGTGLLFCFAKIILGIKR